MAHTTKAQTQPNPHWDFHVHRASQKAIEAGKTAEKYADKTLEFASYKEALQYFLREVNVNPEDVERHFPGNSYPMNFGWQMDTQ